MKYTKIVEFASRYMNQDGSPSVIDASVNGSITPVDFVFEPLVTEAFVIRRILMFGLGTANVTGPAYVDLSALANGTTIKLFNTGGEVFDLTENNPIKSNDLWDSLCFDAGQNTYSANPKSVSARYTLARDTGDDGILLDGSKGEKLVITINDNLSSLLGHFFRVGAKQINV